MSTKRGKPTTESRPHGRQALVLRRATPRQSRALNSPLRASGLQPPVSGLTLIELLVTIVIMVTLLAAVLPAVSPNNEGRKIREASRQLASLFAQAQSQAARDGRSVGVAFEDADGDGIALEAYLVAEPPPFAGFSESSAILVDQIPVNVPPWNRRSPPQFENPSLKPLDINFPIDQVELDRIEPFNITFCHNVGGEAFENDLSDAIPPSTFRVGDVIEVGRERFQIVADDLDNEDNDILPDVDGDPNSLNPQDYGFLKSQQVVAVRWLNRNNRPNALLPPGGRAYKVRRQPAATARIARSPSAALQFPRGVGIDLFCSGVESSFYSQDLPNLIYNYGFTTMKSDVQTLLNGGTPRPFVPQESLSVAIMFRPTGQVDNIYVNGERLNSDASHVHLLLGRIENGTVDPEDPDLDFNPTDVPLGVDGDDILRERRTQFNWLNGDSRLVNIDASSGRVVASDVAIPDPRQLQSAIDGDPVTSQILQQISVSRQYGETLDTAGGR
jgi:type II secretory pathway pseudopilin PulG